MIDNVKTEQPTLDGSLERLTEQIHRTEIAVTALFAILANDEVSEDIKLSFFAEPTVSNVIARQDERLGWQNHRLDGLIERLGKTIGKVKIV